MPRISSEWNLISSGWLLVGLGLLIVILVIIPVLGLTLPLVRDPSAGILIQRAGRLWIERAWPSGQRPLLGAATATIGGFLLTVAARKANAGRWLLPLASLRLALPPGLDALGWVGIAGWLPLEFGPLQSGGWLVGISGGLRAAPLVSTFLVFGLRPLGDAAWQAATLTGMSSWRWWGGVVAPQLGAAIAAAGAVVAMLVAGDIQAELILHPPGEGSFCAHLFAVMDNASAGTVSALAWVHVASIWAMLLLAGVLVVFCRGKGKGPA